MLQYRYTYSKLSTYLQCPLKYKYIYIDRLDKKYRVPKPFLSFGNSMHKALYHFFKMPVDERTKTALQQILRKVWIRDDYTSESEERDFGLKGIDQLNDFYEKEDITLKPLYLEKYFSIRIDDYMLTGKIDRIDETDSGYEIIDYKTGNYIMTPDELKKDMQLPIYLLAAKYDLELPVSKLTYLYLSDVKRVSVAAAEIDIDMLKQQLIEIMKTIESDTEFRPKDNIFCPYCEFSVICPLKGTPPDVIEKKYENIIANLYLLNQAGRVLNMNLTNKKKLVSTLKDTFSELLRFNKVWLIEKNEQSAVPPGFTEIHNKAVRSRHTEYDVENSIMAIPLISEDQVTAVMLMSSPKGEKIKIGDNVLTLANTLAGNASIALKNAELYEMAITDTLTKLYTRRFVLLRLEEEIAKAARYKVPMSVIMFDIDRFKRINDTFGHRSGDTVLVKLSEIMKNETRNVDIPGRLGGEEFLIILPMTSAENAFVLAERIRKSFEETEFIFKSKDEREHKLHITVSGGIAEFEEGLTITDILDRSDKALYFSKDSGRNLNTIYSENLWNTMLEKINKEHK